MHFQLKPEDEPLIQAAIGMGDWLLAHPATTEEQKQPIHLLQDALRRLPAVTPELDAFYGFHYDVGGDLAVGLHRGWQVTLYPPGVLEIFSTYTPEPYPKDIQDMTQFELMFHLYAGEPNYGDTFYAAEWIAEVSSPESHLPEGICLKIDAGA